MERCSFLPAAGLINFTSRWPAKRHSGRKSGVLKELLNGQRHALCFWLLFLLFSHRSKIVEEKIEQIIEGRLLCLPNVCSHICFTALSQCKNNNTQRDGICHIQHSQPPSLCLHVELPSLWKCNNYLLPMDSKESAEAFVLADVSLLLRGSCFVEWMSRHSHFFPLTLGGGGRRILWHALKTERGQTFERTRYESKSINDKTLSSTNIRRKWFMLTECSQRTIRRARPAAPGDTAVGLSRATFC